MTTRDKILNEALTLFAENGYDGTSVEEIAEKVGIKAPSLYNHFKGKEDILNALIELAEARYEEFFGYWRKPVMRNSSARTSISASCRRAKRNSYKRRCRRFLLPCVTR